MPVNIEAIVKELFQDLDSDAILYVASKIEECADKSPNVIFEEICDFVMCYDIMTEEQLNEKCKSLSKRLHDKHPRPANDKQKHPTKRLDIPFNMSDAIDVAVKKSEAASMLWTKQEIQLNTNTDIDEDKNLELARARKDRTAQRSERKKGKVSPTEDDFIEAEAPKLNVEIGALGKTKDVYVEDISLGVKDKTLLTGSDLHLIYGHRYGLIGRNGVGKSTLLRNIARRQISGFPAHISVMCVEQEIHETTQSVMDVVLESNTIYIRLIRRKEELESLAKSEKISTKELEELQSVYTEIHLNGYETATVTATHILEGLGFSESMIKGDTKSLSGGWRMRVSLAAALFSKPDLLLLDEPTNHLDIGTVIWLESFLSTLTGTLVVVSHDRLFLNGVCTDIILMRQQQLLYFKGDYDAFVRNYRDEQLNNLRERKNIQEQIAHMMTFVNRFRYNAVRAPLVQSRLKAIHKLELKMENIPEVIPEAQVRFEFNSPNELPFPILQAIDVSFGYTPDKILFRDITFGMELSSRIGILGPNGIGKTTLAKLLLGDLVPLTGQIMRNNKLRSAVFTQHHTDQLDYSLTPLQLMRNQFPQMDEPSSRSQLARFGVTEEMAERPIRTLSGGQKTRVSFALITGNNPHILILDEPSNHLDIETIETLASALKKFTGGVVVVSHDQYFVGMVCQELWTIQNQRIIRFNGDFHEYKALVAKGKLQ